MSKKTMQSWGKYPQVDHESHTFIDTKHLSKLILKEDEFIAHGNGRSYGDSALGKNIINLSSHDYFLDFDTETGLLHVQSGVLLSDILEHFIPRGWFLKVVPGTKYITIGGAIASDVHGKNHHIEGCFSNGIKEFTIMLPSGEVKKSSKSIQKTLFHATCGGQGLTGVILDAKIYLKKISSNKIKQTTIKTNNLKQTFEAFEKYKNAPYSVAWIDCMAQGEDIGNCILNTGDFVSEKHFVQLSYNNKKKLNIPFNFPTFALNQWSIKAFNWLYKKFTKNGTSHQEVDIDSFFFPLDGISNWNNIYGKKGFVQYQCILPLENSYNALQIILGLIAKSGYGSFLAVLKLHGESNDNYLSFPLRGYSLALDFKLNDKVLKLLDNLDEIVNQNNGRVYLTKDARISKENFENGYPMINKFREYRRKNNMNQKFQSAQSKRLGL